VLSFNLEIDRSLDGSNPTDDRNHDLLNTQANNSLVGFIKDLLHSIWIETKLTHWDHDCKRDWSIARRLILSAAKRFKINGAPLSSHLFVPHEYSSKAEQDACLEWSRFLTDLQDSQNCGYILAPVRDIYKNVHGAFFSLRYLFEPILISDLAYETLFHGHSRIFKWLDYVNRRGKRYEKDCLFSSTGWIDLQRPAVIAIMRMEVKRGRAWARAIHLMPVHPQTFLPANNSDEVLLINELRKNSYQFSRLLTSENPSSRIRPMWCLKDVLDPMGNPVNIAAIEILYGNNGAAVLQTRRQAAIDLARSGTPLLVWSPRGAQVSRIPPILPPHCHGDICEARLTLEAIRTSNEVCYGYGADHLNQFKC
jgi:hypothetical protein